MQRLTLPKDTFTWEQRNSWKGRSWEKHRGRLGHISGEGAAGFEARHHLTKAAVVSFNAHGPRLTTPYSSSLDRQR